LVALSKNCSNPKFSFILNVKLNTWESKHWKCLITELFLPGYYAMKTRVNGLVRHSRCSLRENPNLLQNFRCKKNTLKKIFDQYFCLISAIVIQA
jgi:hypothetical protein